MKVWEHTANVACRHARMYTQCKSPPGVEPIIQPAETVADQSVIDVKWHWITEGQMSHEHMPGDTDGCLHKHILAIEKI